MANLVKNQRTSSNFMIGGVKSRIDSFSCVATEVKEWVGAET